MRVAPFKQKLPIRSAPLLFMGAWGVDHAPKRRWGERDSDGVADLAFAACAINLYGGVMLPDPPKGSYIDAVQAEEREHCAHLVERFTAAHFGGATSAMIFAALVARIRAGEWEDA